jgi:3-deoxy-D-manno-octulosonate 8-phosphate phosphatase (KDO 8-P phosphatase)
VTIDPQVAFARARRIQLVITDNDGVLTDGIVYVSPAGEQLKAYSVRDGMGVERLRRAGLATGVLTREQPALIEPRAKKLELPYLWTGVRDKRAHLSEIFVETGLASEQLAYIGDDINDIEIIQAIGAHGLTAAPADAMPEVRARVHYVCDAVGGRGAFREFAEWLLALRGSETLEANHAKRDPDR